MDAVGTDQVYMREALHLARRGAGATSPNPMVGAVVVSAGEIVGRGFHPRAGEPHAEIFALRDARARARGSTLYVTLEPCAHWGRTPPCTQAIIAAGVRRVVAAMADPDPQVSGRGFRRLAEAGVETCVGVVEREAQDLNEAYVKHRTVGLPFVTAKWAMTLDGRIATRTGDSRWISGEASRAIAHEIRATSDAILVGIGTILRDDPALTARTPIGRNPRRIVLDSRLRIPPNARVLARDGTPVIVAATGRASPEARKALEARGVEVLVADGPDARVDLGAVLRELGRRGVMSLLVEGGGTVHGAFVDAGLVDKVMIFVGPLIVGGPAPAPVGGVGVEAVAQAWQIQRATIRQVEQDVVIEGYLSRPAHASHPAEMPRPAEARTAAPLQEGGSGCSPAS
ncbi:MAG TPA: bifunctional diaminohydroxyphosphoribosylaminopyrimidine deaminase/5-amino-6-(5-phosphoribosylamino)uracil reductase RibD [bacterium]|nr:bifunctional diaminohydroxyphosphoribosylaminopyrimidine deaminase/5-amino-6-(5-phosphoribosylamino)uracil reductase RibD [bacterium]